MINSGTISFHYPGGKQKNLQHVAVREELGLCECHWLQAEDNRELRIDVEL